MSNQSTSVYLNIYQNWYKNQTERPCFHQDSQTKWCLLSFTWSIFKWEPNHKDPAIKSSSVKVKANWPACEIHNQSHVHRDLGSRGLIVSHLFPTYSWRFHFRSSVNRGMPDFHGYTFLKPGLYWAVNGIWILCWPPINRGMSFKDFNIKIFYSFKDELSDPAFPHWA